MEQALSEPTQKDTNQNQPTPEDMLSFFEKYYNA